MGKKTKILVVDDNADILFATKRVLKSAGYEVREASSAKECMAELSADCPDLLLLDVVLPDADGRELCSQLKADPDLQGIFVVLLSGIKISSNDQVEGLDLGADGYIARPIANKELLARIQAMDRIRLAEGALRKANDELERRVQERTTDLATANERLQQELEDRRRAEEALCEALSEVKRLQQQLETDNIYLREEIKLEHDFKNIIGNSDEIKYALFRLEQVAKTDSAVIILGETGTGKELIARALHDTSARAARPLVKVNCATLPEQFIESELFGHVKGAFTGAVKDRQGRFELANGGTLFLDEIGELPSTLQAKLLRVLQDGEFEKLGDSRTIKTEVRLITATNRDLEALVKAGKFRKDLWYRLNVFPITLPPLRDRKDDIPLLVDHFIKKIGKRIGKEIYRIPNSVLNELVAYDWPGNVRELEHVLERSMIASSGRHLQLTERLVSGSEETHRDNMQTHSDMEREHILRVLKQTGWVIEGPRGAARILDIHPNTLRYRMKKLAIHRPGK